MWVWSGNGKPHSREAGETVATHTDMDNTRKHNVQWKQQIVEEYIEHGSVYIYLRVYSWKHIYLNNILFRDIDRCNKTADKAKKLSTQTSTSRMP